MLMISKVGNNNNSKHFGFPYLFKQFSSPLFWFLNFSDDLSHGHLYLKQPACVPFSRADYFPLSNDTRHQNKGELPSYGHSSLHKTQSKTSPTIILPHWWVRRQDAVYLSTTRHWAALLFQVENGGSREGVGRNSNGITQSTQNTNKKRSNFRFSKQTNKIKNKNKTYIFWDW